jgi:hypothetical protein
MKSYHVVPVPRGYTAEQVYLETKVFGRLVDYRWWRPRFHWPFLKWATIEVEEPDG